MVGLSLILAVLSMIAQSSIWSIIGAVCSFIHRSMVVFLVLTSLCVEGLFLTQPDIHCSTDIFICHSNNKRH